MKLVIGFWVVVVLFVAGIVAVPILVVASLAGDDKDSSSGQCAPVAVGGSYSGGNRSTAELAPDWAANAAIIISVANQRGLGTQGAVVGLATAMQESRLGNINYGDRDSLGLFQQRPSQGWGRPDQLLNPSFAAGKFFDVLVTIPNWQSLPVTVAAQRVQRSGFPQAYAQWEALSRALLSGGTSIAPDSSQPALDAACNAAQDVTVSPDVAGVIAAMEPYLGTAYVWGGGTLTSGPFDCSSYVRYGYYQATGIIIPRVTRDQYAAASIHITDRSQLQPGDLLYFASNTRNPGSIHHVGLYVGDKKMLHAPRTGDVLKYVDNIWGSSYWSGEFIGAIRPLSDPAFR